MDSVRFRACICYLITTVLLSLFFYTLLNQNIQNKKMLERLREEVDELTHLAIRSSPSGGDDQPKHLTDLIETILKKKLSAIWDDLYAVKKQLRTTECSSLGTRRQIRDVNEKVYRINFASEQLGARIYSVIAEPASGTNFLKALLGLEFESNPPVNMLREDMHPGNCFGFKNKKAEVTVKLAKEIVMDSLELEHILPSMSPTSETSSAPKAFKFFGVTCDGRDVLLGDFEYLNTPSNRIQQYDIKCPAKYTRVKFKFESNHGNPNFTCVYRVAIYGKM